MARTDL